MSETGISVFVRRKEDRRFLTGNCNYLGDMNVAGQTYAYFVRLPIKHSGLRAAVELVRGRQTGRVDQRVIDALSPLGATNIDMPATSQKVWQAIQAAAA